MSRKKKSDNIEEIENSDPWMEDNVDIEEDVEFKKEEPKEVPEVIQEDPPKPSIPLKVFIKIAGPKPDQMAGFKHFAKTNKLGPMSVPEWRACYQSFLARPVKRSKRG